MDGIKIKDWRTFINETSSDVVSAVNQAMDVIGRNASSQAERWAVIAGTYETMYQSAANRASYFQTLAELNSNSSMAESWRRVASQFQEAANQRRNMADHAYAQTQANLNATKFAKVLGPTAWVATDGVALANAAMNGDANKVGEILTGGLYGSMFARGAHFFLAMMRMHPVGRLLAYGAAAFLGTEFGKQIWKSITGDTNNIFNRAMNWIMRRDPLTLDLDGDGIESVGINQTNPVTFDHDGDSIRTGTGWISSDDGFLVLDRNGNGTIDSGRELFGDSTPIPGGTAADGFAALAAEDTNGDGAITSDDARFSDLRVWRDLNQDGNSQAGELFTLQQIGITAINVASVERNQVLANGNQIADVGTYVRSDGSEGAIAETHGSADVDLAENPFYREFEDGVPLVEGLDGLPNMGGSGRVRDLWEAASQSPALLSLLQQFTATETRAGQLALIDSLLLTWARTGGMQTMGQRAEAINHRFGWWRIGEMTYPGSGTAWTAGSGGGGGGGTVAIMPSDFPDPELWEQRRAEWDALVIRTNDMFAILEAFNGRYFFAMPEETSGSRVGVALVADSGGSGGGGTAYVPGPPGITIGIAEAQFELLTASYEALRDSVYSALALQTRLQAYTEEAMLVLDPRGSDFIIDFTSQEEEFARRISLNVVDGMADLIEYTRGMASELAGSAWRGWDVVEEYVRTLPTSPELQALLDHYGLNFATAETSSVRAAETGGILLGTGANNTLYGSTSGDALLGGAGNDSLHAGVSSDSLLGQAGNDYLYGEDGDDVMIGGVGNDYSTGGSGNDLYVFDRGDGQDSIYNHDSGLGRNDTLAFKPGIRAEDVVLSRSGDSLVIQVKDSSDRVVVNSFFHSDDYALNSITFVDGTTWDLATIKLKVQTGTEGDDTLTAHESGSVLYGLGGNDTLQGNVGEDTLIDNSGANILRGGAGSDTITGNGTIEGGTGNDQLTGTSNSTLYIYNLGDGFDTITDSGYGSASYADTLQLGAGITPASVTFLRTGNDLTLRFSETDQVTVKNWFADVYYNAIERVTFADGTVWDHTAMQQFAIAPFTGTAGNDTISGWDGIDTIDGGEGNDTVYGASGNDVLSGGAGNDTLRAGEGHDTVSGGVGNDAVYGDGGNDTVEGNDGDDTLQDNSGANILRGGAGIDTITGTGTIEGGTGNDQLNGASNSTLYIYNLGDGIDTITDSGYGSALYADTLQLGAGITPASVTLLRTGNDLVFRISDTDQIIVKNWYSDVYYNAIENITFADGTVWTHATMYSMTTQPFVATSAAETVNGWAGIDIIDGGDGNDIVYGNEGNDVLAGAAGNDTVRGGEGNDLVSGGVGNDTLYGDGGDDTVEGNDGDDTLHDNSGANILRGGAGADIITGTGTIEGGTGNDQLNGASSSTLYVYNLGDGIDTITDYGYGSATYADTLQLGAGINPASVTFVRSGNDLVFRFSETDQVTVKNWFADVYYNAVERVTFADGTVWDHAALQASVGQQFLGTSGADTINGWDGIDLIDGAEGNDTIYGAGGNDTLMGSAGNDTLRGGEGTDLLSGGADNDILYGDGGNDTLEGNEGDDTLNDNSGVNILRGGAGADVITGMGTFEGGTGNDQLNGSSNSTFYVYNLGDGIDTITDYGYGSATYADTLQLGAGISPASVTLLRVGNDLTFRISDTDQIIVKNWFSDVYYNAIENITFADGTVWTHAAMYSMTTQPFVATSAADTVNGWAGIDIIDGGDGNDIVYGNEGNDAVSGSAGNDTVRGGEGNDTVTGGIGNDILYGDGGNDTVEGDDGDDTLHDNSGANILRGGAGVDIINGMGTFEGGTGNDQLNGSSSSTLYLYNLGDGIDTITDYGYGSATYADTLQLGAGINPASVTLVRTGNDMSIRISDTDQITVKNWYSDVYYNAIENITFADGTVWTHATMYSMTTQPFVATSAADTVNGWEGIDIIDGADGNDTLNGAGANDVLSGSAGNDTVRGGEGNDQVNGGIGNDTLYGDGGNDTVEGNDGDDTLNDNSGANLLRGGAGNDIITGMGTLEGGTGNDQLNGASSSTSYVYNLGDGIDTITDNGYGSATYADTLQLGAGITPASISLVRSGNDLTFRISDTDQIIVKNWYADVYYNAIENIAFADGTVWTHASMQSVVPQQIHVGTAGAETIHGWFGIDLIDGAGGNDTINGNEGNDLLIGNDGNDILNGHAGTDLLQGGAGDDQLNDSTGVGLFDGGAGNDTLAGSSSANFFAGGAGNDTITTGSGVDIIGFNRGDGADTVAYSTGTDNTLSLGGGIAYADLSLRRNGNDLIVDAGSGDQVTFQSWYTSTQYRSVLNLQVVAEAMAGFNPGGADGLLDQKVETFNFAGLVTRFDQERAANPAITSWSVMAALLEFQSAGSDTAALGGDLAHEFGLNRSLNGVGYGAAQTAMNDSTFGVTAQALNSAAAVYTGQVRLT